MNYMLFEKDQTREKNEENQKRLKELRKKQGRRIDYTNQKFLEKYHFEEKVDDKDFKIYTV